MKIILILAVIVVIVHSGRVVPKQNNAFGIGKAIIEIADDDEGVMFARGRSSEESSDSSSSESDSEEDGPPRPTTTRATTTRRTTTTRPTTTRRTTTTRPTTTRRTTTTRPTTTRRTTTTTPKPITTTRTTPQPTTTTTTPKPTTTTTTTTTTTPKPVTTPPPPPTTTTGVPGECQIMCRRGDHYLVNPANCNSFFQCSNGTPIYQPCPVDLVFNPIINVCVTRDAYHCVETCDRIEVLYRNKVG